MHQAIRITLALLIQIGTGTFAVSLAWRNLIREGDVSAISPLAALALIALIGAIGSWSIIQQSLPGNDSGFPKPLRNVLAGCTILSIVVVGMSLLPLDERLAANCGLAMMMATTAFAVSVCSVELKPETGASARPSEVEPSRLEEQPNEFERSESSNGTVAITFDAEQMTDQGLKEDELWSPDCQSWQRRTQVFDQEQPIEVIEGMLRAKLLPGERQARVHLPLTPPLKELLSVEVEPVDLNSEVDVSVGEQRNYGVRFEVNNKTRSNHEQSVGFAYRIEAAA